MDSVSIQAVEDLLKASISEEEDSDVCCEF